MPRAGFFLCRKLTKYQVLLVASTQGLVAGGVAGLFWSYVWTYAGMALVVLSLAEMASMAPTSGGQYREYQSLFSKTATSHSQHQRRLGLRVCSSEASKVA